MVVKAKMHEIQDDLDIFGQEVSPFWKIQENSSFCRYQINVVEMFQNFRENAKTT